jgi:hypothetical protein
VIRDEGNPEWVRLDLCDWDGLIASVRVGREMLAPYARSLLDAAIRNP